MSNLDKTWNQSRYLEAFPSPPPPTFTLLLRLPTYCLMANGDDKINKYRIWQGNNKMRQWPMAMGRLWISLSKSSLTSGPSQSNLYFIYQMNKTLAEQKSDPQRRRRDVGVTSTQHSAKKKTPTTTYAWVCEVSVYMHVYLCTYVHVCMCEKLGSNCL